MKERVDRDFAREIEMRVSYFLQSEEEELELEPMNSYRRRMVHNLAAKYRLRTESRGEDRERYVCLIKTGDTPAKAPPGAGAADAAPHRAADGPPHRSAGGAPHRSADGPPPRATDDPGPSRPARLWDFGSQTFPVNPGQDGIHLALKVDGSIELWSEHNRSHILTDRVVTTREFRIRQGRIVMPGEEGY